MPTQDLTPVYAMGMKLFWHVVIKDSSIRPRFRSLILNLIADERNVRISRWLLDVESRNIGGSLIRRCTAESCGGNV